jgi:hypothetical protein
MHYGARRCYRFNRSQRHGCAFDRMVNGMRGTRTTRRQRHDLRTSRRYRAYPYLLSLERYVRNCRRSGCQTRSAEGSRQHDGAYGYFGIPQVRGRRNDRYCAAK